MRRSHDTSIVRKLWIRRGLLVILTCLVLLLGGSIWGIYEKYREAKQRKEELSHTLQELEKREAELKMKVEALATERGVESEIRSKFQVAKEGEGVIYLVEGKTAEPEVPAPQQNIWSWLLSWFGL